MPKLPKVITLFSILLLISLIITFKHLDQVRSFNNQVVISEIQIAGDIANDEFVELYNPSDAVVNLEGWRLSKTSSTGGSPSNLASTIYGSIPAHGYFLIAHPSYNGAANADLFYTATSSGIAADNHVILYSDAGGTEVDRVGLGAATQAEGNPIGTNPDAHASVERKAVAASTSVTMRSGGTHEFWGNGYDSNDNLLDFVLRSVAGPQNKSWPPEAPGGITPTPSTNPSPTLTPTVTPTTQPSPIPTITPVPTQTPTPSATPTSTPTPTPILTPTPTSTPTPQPTYTPTPTSAPSPTETPEPTDTPQPTSTPTTAPSPTTTPTPTITPAPTPTPTDTFSFLNVSCQRSYRTFRIFTKIIYFPHITCSIYTKPSTN